MSQSNNILAPDQTTYNKPAGKPPFSNLSNVAPGGAGGPNMSGPGASRCLFYFVYLDEFNHPIPGTMFGKNNNQVIGCVEKIARLTGKVMVPPAGYVQCFPKTGLRYWYQVKSTPTGGGNSRTEILPNSMIAVKGVPKEMGTNSAGINGPGRSCQYIEYKVFKKQDNQ